MKLKEIKHINNIVEAHSEGMVFEYCETASSEEGADILIKERVEIPWEALRLLNNIYEARSGGRGTPDILSAQDIKKLKELIEGRA